MSYEFKVVDCNERELKVGTRCVYGAPPAPCQTDETYKDYLVEVIEVSDPDVDYSDELQRAVQICPFVTVKFNTGETEQISSMNVTKVTWADYPDGPETEIFEVGDLEVDEDVSR